MGAHRRELTFAEAFHEAAGRARTRRVPPGECVTDRGRKCPLCWARPLDYDLELQARQEALRSWWPEDCPLEPLVPSPRGRDYRTVSKRRVLKGQLALIGDRMEPLPVVRCRLEPASHQRLYDRVKGSPVMRELNFAIVKGTYEEDWLLLNLARLSPTVVAAARKLSADLGESIQGLTLLHGRPGDAYYLNATRTLKIWGTDQVRARFGGRTFRYPLTVFTQVNHSLVDRMLETAAEMLSGLPLVDLYCGFGLFALSLPSPRVLGLEWSAPAVQAAQANARRLRPEGARFKTVDLGPQSLLRELPRGEFEVLLDPPHGGPAEGLIEALASRGPARAVHFFCDVERVPHDLAAWRRAGYRPVRAVPFDMFPGTAELEVAVLLERARGSAPRPAGGAERGSGRTERGGSALRRTPGSQYRPKGGPK